MTTLSDALLNEDMRKYYHGDVMADAAATCDRYEKVKDCTSVISEALACYPEEDSLQSAISALNRAVKLNKAEMVAAVLAAVAELERVQYEMYNAGEYGKDLFKSLRDSV